MKRNKPFVSFQAHPPERKSRSTTLMAHGCCCCCFHSFGGIAGSIWGSIRRNAPDPETLVTPEAVRAEDETKAAHRLAVKVYWLALTVIAALATAILMIAIPLDELVGPFLVLFWLPAGQLLASLVTALWIKFRPPIRKSEAYRRLIRITVFAFLGGLIGIVGIVVSFLTLGR